MAGADEATTTPSGAASSSESASGFFTFFRRFTSAVVDRELDNERVVRRSVSAEELEQLVVARGLRRLADCERAVLAAILSVSSGELVRFRGLRLLAAAELAAAKSTGADAVRDETEEAEALLAVRVVVLERPRAAGFARFFCRAAADILKKINSDPTLHNDRNRTVSV